MVACPSQLEEQRTDLGHLAVLHLMAMMGGMPLKVRLRRATSSASRRTATARGPSARILLSKAELRGTALQEGGDLLLGLYGDYIGIMEKNMETAIVYGGFIGIMEKKMETTI